MNQHYDPNENGYPYPYTHDDERQFNIPGMIGGLLFPGHNPWGQQWQGGPWFGGPGGGPGAPFPGQGPGGQFPGGPGGPGGPGSGPSSGPPTSPPPSFTPQSPQEGGITTFAVDPGGIRGCLFRFTYVWLRRDAFWYFPTFVGRRSIAGYRWNGFRWVYFGIDLNRIQSFQCY